MLYSEAALNRVLPIIKNTPLVNPLKKIAEKQMRISGQPSRTSREITLMQK